MWPDRVSNPGPLTYESGALPTTLRGPAALIVYLLISCGSGSHALIPYLQIYKNSSASKIIQRSRSIYLCSVMGQLSTSSLSRTTYVN